MSGPTGPALPPPGAPQVPRGPQGPRGPRPMPGINPTGPVAGPRQGPPAPPPAPPAAPQPTINPMALMMPALDSLVKPTPTEVPNDALVKAKRLMSGLQNVQKLKQTALAPTGEPASLGAAATPVTADVTAPKTMADVLRNAELRAAAKPKKITKTNGKVETEAPPPPKAEAAAFEPFAEDTMIYPEGITARQYGEAEAQSHGTSSERYKKNAERTAAAWIKTTNLLSSQFPGYKPSFKATLRHLIEIGSDREKRRAAIEHFSSHVPDDVAAAMREQYK